MLGEIRLGLSRTVIGAGVDGEGEPSDPAPDQGLGGRVADAQRDVGLAPAEVEGDIADDEFDLDARIAAAART